MNLQYNENPTRIRNCCTTNTSSTLSTSWLSNHEHRAQEYYMTTGAQTHSYAFYSKYTHTNTHTHYKRIQSYIQRHTYTLVNRSVHAKHNQLSQKPTDRCSHN